MNRHYNLMTGLTVGLLTLLFVSGASAQEVAVVDVNASSTYGLSAEEIAAYSPPDFEQLTVDQNLLHDRNYVRVSGNVNIYDAPNGNVLRTLDEGFNFFTTIQTADGWTQINRDEWVLTEHLSNSNYVVSNFTGLFLPDEALVYPTAWMLVNAYVSAYPGGPALESNRLLYRYDRVDIFDSVMVDGWRWYQVGVDEWVDQRNVAKYVPIEKPAEVETERWVGIDLYEQVLTVYDGEKPIFTTLVATGLPRWPTYEGTFNIYFRRVRTDMSWGTPGDDFYLLEEVPWTMFFDEGRALHGAYWHDGLGYRRSHGCVNLSITDAYWLYHWVAEEFETLNSPDREVGPAVHVYSSGEYVN